MYWFAYKNNIYWMEHLWMKHLRMCLVRMKASFILANHWLVLYPFQKWAWNEVKLNAFNSILGHVVKKVEFYQPFVQDLYGSMPKTIQEIMMSKEWIHLRALFSFVSKLKPNKGLMYYRPCIIYIQEHWCQLECYGVETNSIN